LEGAGRCGIEDGEKRHMVSNDRKETETRATIALPEDLLLPIVSETLEQIARRVAVGPIDLDCSRVARCDSAGVALINHVRTTYPDTRLLHTPAFLEILLAKFPRGSEPHKPGANPDDANRLGQYLLLKLDGVRRAAQRYMILLADEAYHTLKFCLHPRRRQGVFPGEIFNQLYFMAYDSFPIICLISFLVGLTISITSLEQLNMFGANLYLADLVGFGMIRELVPLMTGIILAGKIGASITAEISSMVVLEEVDALRTMAVDPEKFIMVPRILAITMAIPLLIGMADAVGIFGGILVGKVFSNIPVSVFLKQMFGVVGIGDFLIGAMKTLVFGWIVVISAGYKGFSAQRSAQGVGIATTESVVLSISLIIVIDCVFAFFLY